MIHVSEQVSTKWARLSAQENKPYISLLLVSRQAPGNVHEMVEEAATEAAATLERDWEEVRASGSGQDLGIGAVSSAVMPEGVAITIGGGAEQFEQQLGLIIKGLERRGIEGMLDVFRPRRVRPLPYVIPLVQCHLRVLGERHHASGPHYHWRVDHEAWSTVISAATEWCRKVPGQATIKAGLMPRTVLNPTADPARLVGDAVEADQIRAVDFSSGDSRRFRMLALRYPNRLLSIIEASEAIGQQGWLEAVASMIEFLTETSDLLLYAFIKHGTAVMPARDGYAILKDWPTRSDLEYSLRMAPPFEDCYAPDAFAVQLLGPGYVGRIPTGPTWTLTELARDRFIVQHRNPEKWFAVPFAPRGGQAHQAPSPPRVLTLAREALANILFRDGLL